MKTVLGVWIILVAAATYCSKAMSVEISATLPSPFPNTISSIYGPRFLDKPGKVFHNGIDYAAPQYTPIPSVSDGRIYDIRAYNDALGNRTIITSSGSVIFGYGHMFYNGGGSDIPAPPDNPEFFFIRKSYELALPPAAFGPIRTKSCYTILVKKQGIAWVPESCAFAKGKKFSYPDGPGGAIYTVRNSINAKEPIGPVGDSGTAKGSPHLHLMVNSGRDNPHHFISHLDGLSGSFCAKLSDSDPATGICDALTEEPVITSSILGTRKYIEVRIDHTGRLDLDGVSFELSSTPMQFFFAGYGGAPYVEPGASWDEIGNTIDLQCTRVPLKTQIIICPLDWRGQKGKNRLETRFRLGIDSSMIPAGANYVEAKIRNTYDVVNTIRLPFKMEVDSARYRIRGTGVDDRVKITNTRSDEVILDAGFGTLIDQEFSAHKGDTLQIQAFDNNGGFCYALGPLVITNLATSEEKTLHPGIPGHCGPGGIGRSLFVDASFIVDF